MLRVYVFRYMRLAIKIGVLLPLLHFLVGMGHLFDVYTYIRSDCLLLLLLLLYEVLMLQVQVTMWCFWTLSLCLLSLWCSRRGQYSRARARHG